MRSWRGAGDAHSRGFWPRRAVLHAVHELAPAQRLPAGPETSTYPYPRTVVDIAVQAGHSPTMTLDTYGHVIDELDPGQRRSAEELINEAREAGVRILCAREAELADAAATEKTKPLR